MLLRLDCELWRLKTVVDIIAHNLLLLNWLLLLLLFRSFVKVPSQLNTDFGWRNFASLSRNGLLLQQLSLDLLLNLSQLLLLQLNALQTLNQSEMSIDMC